jgi:hypothetical protein
MAVAVVVVVIIPVLQVLEDRVHQEQAQMQAVLETVAEAELVAD